jgi:hypothetical protein
MDKFKVDAQIKVPDDTPTTCLPKLRGRQVAANLPACRNFGEGRKEPGYGG